MDQFLYNIRRNLNCFRPVRSCDLLGWGSMSLGALKNHSKRRGSMSRGCFQQLLKQVGVQSLFLGSHSHLTLISRASHSHPTLLSLSTCDSSKVVQDFVHQSIDPTCDTRLLLPLLKWKLNTVVSSENHTNINGGIDRFPSIRATVWCCAEIDDNGTVHYVFVEHQYGSM
jgi:hypothetical protein